MTEIQIDEQVASTAAWSDDDVAVLDLDGAEQALLEEIMSTPTLEQVPASVAPAPATPPGPLRPRPKRLLAMIATAAAFAAAIVVPSHVAGRDPGPTPDTRYSAYAIEVARANPRVLVAEPGWRVSHVDSFTADEGEIAFSGRGRVLEVNWRSKATYQGYLDDRMHVSRPQQVDVVGQHGRLFRYGAHDFGAMLPPQGDVFLELRGSGGDKAAFLDLMSHLEQVDVDTWLAAMPASVVKGGEQAAVAAEMLSDIPTPPDFDAGRLADGKVRDYYQFGARVTDAVACAWLDSWTTAHRNGDAAGMRRAVAAMATSRHWKVLQKMDAQGDFPDVLWELADQLASGSYADGHYYFDCSAQR